MATDRVAPGSTPSSEDGEKGVLCSLLLSPKEVADLCRLQLRTEAFFIPAHQIIYDLILEFHEECAGEAELIIAKQRNGPTVEVKLTFLKEYYAF